MADQGVQVALEEEYGSSHHEGGLSIVGLMERPLGGSYCVPKQGTAQALT
jgi:hypothetical protein